MPGVTRDEHAPHAGRRGPLRLVERVEHDEAHLGLGRRAELLVALVVAVHDDPLARRSRRARAKASSPSVETSAPKPSSASSRRSATFGNAFRL